LRPENFKFKFSSEEKAFSGCFLKEKLRVESHDLPLPSVNGQALDPLSLLDHHSPKPLLWII
jgi:hypothetical protein